MQDIWPQLRSWFIGSERFALATVVKASKPSPRGVGSVLAIHENGERFIGSVSAGCVENEVIEASKSCLADGKTRWLSFGPGEGFPWEIELSCGGKIEIRIEPAPHLREGNSDFVDALVAAMDRHEAVLWTSDGITDTLTELREDVLTEEVRDGEVRVLRRALRRRRRLFVVGASHIALHLVAAAKMLQYEVVVIDPRENYARGERFQLAPDEVLTAWPGTALGDYALASSDSLVAITHDPKIDDDALAAALTTDCGYVGALGSRKSHAARCRRLAKRGISEADLDRIFGPVGLDIGSRTPAEIAISIVAQLVLVRNQGSEKNGEVF
ncbi:XdhC family protein [Pelagicoccus sp. SDUM812002]|uniref:XdhC family protein n=1 Tax=Pelagicoccus sp. SDUM812002 TaxID=3041266 RepID=UPI00280C6B1C|nr:XdhC family protein [Pelagicoccus sp. SDUM812002]MDQ8186332.1 XdhC family protein [Pelagicoccus sp. SDUM812002]